ncbi:MAG: lipoyl protein ligase domain-containing protein [Thermocrinis sp.]|jgi:lipoate-protein ligase A|uniref:lipoyl protein ligase domain-containing protein n=1 Tax=Thermocrinis sp. TaxID=2024383 RepID=UPI003C037765
MIEVLDGYENMQKDYENFLRVEEGGGPFFRIYLWKKPVISLGFHQEPRDFPVDVVKRPTGGGALLHGWDISFSVVDAKEIWGKSPKKIYLRLMGLLKESLEDLGLSLGISNYGGSYGEYFCIFQPTFGEITHRGKKLVACAMRMGKRGFLLHGSLFWTLDYLRAEQIMGIPSERLRDRMITFEELSVSWEELLKAVEDFFTRILLCKTSYSL